MKNEEYVPTYVTEIFDTIREIAERNIVLFGAASAGKRAVVNLMQKGIEKKRISFFDNSDKKWGTEILGIKVLSREEFKNLPKDTPIFISSSMYQEIMEQLQNDYDFTNVRFVRALVYAEQFSLKYSDEFLKLLDEVKEKCFMEHEEKFTLYSSMKAVSGIEGEVAEVGIYKGGSAKILSATKGEKAIHLFDTFDGLPDSVSADDLVKKGWLKDTSLDEVQKYLSEYARVFFYKGMFPKTSGPISDKRFCLVHLDTDIYQGTIDGLKFFWPRMVKGGRIITHDYNNITCPGVKKAFKEFFSETPELIIDIADSQAMVVKQ